MTFSNSRIRQGGRTLADLPLYRHSVSEDVTGKQVRHIFKADTHTPGVLVLGKNGALSGLLSRQHFQEVLLTPYGSDLYLKRPIGKIANRTPLLLEHYLGLDEAAQRTLARGRDHLSEPAVVWLDQHDYAILDTQVLLETLAHELADRNRVADALLTELQNSNAKLATAMDQLGRTNAELEQFVYAASHDLRQPLRMVSGYMNKLRKELAGNTSETVQICMDYASQGAKRMDALIVSLLDYSRTGRMGGETEILSVADVVEEALSNLHFTITELNATVRVGMPLPLVIGNRLDLARLFQNLIGNALKYRHPDRPPNIKISCQDDGEFWLLQVQDNGIGIDPQHHERVFGIFQRLVTEQKIEGTGIGLALCRKIVDHHGGRIWVQSEAGQGSTFALTLPKTHSDLLDGALQDGREKTVCRMRQGR